MATTTNVLERASWDQRMSRTGTIDGCIERSETTEGILAIAGIEIDVAEADVEFEVDVRVFLGQVGGSTRFPGPVVAFEADRQVQFRVDEQPHLVEQEVRLAAGVNRLDELAVPRSDRHVGVEDDHGLVRAEFGRPAASDRVDERADARFGDRVTVVFHRPRRAGLELESAGEELGESHVMREYLAAVLSFDEDRLTTLIGVRELEIDAFGLGPRLHRHHIKRRQPAVDSLTFVESAYVVGHTFKP